MIRFDERRRYCSAKVPRAPAGASWF